MPTEPIEATEPAAARAVRAIAVAIAGRSQSTVLDGLRPSGWLSGSVAMSPDPIDMWSPVDGGAAEGRTRVLLVDDEPDEFVLCRELLMRAGEPGFSLQWARTFEIGLEMLGRDHPAVCLVDYQLGGQSGLDFVREARATSPGSEIPLIVMTGRGDRAVDADALEAGAADYLDKLDLTPAMLERSIRHAIERSATLRALRASEDFHRSIIGSMAEAVLVLTAAGCVLAANPAAGRILQLPPDALVGRWATDEEWSWFDLEGQPLVGLDHPLRMAAGRSAPSLTVTISRRDGTDRLIEMSVESMPDARSDAAFVVSFEDVTDIRQAARRMAHAERVDALDRLAGNVAHDFNNLITVMRGCLDLLELDGTDAAESAGLFETLRVTADRASDLTRNLLDLRGPSRIEARDLDLGPFLAALRGTVQQLVGRAIVLEVATVAEPTIVRMDPKRLELAILNLAANARDAMPDGGRLAIGVDTTDSLGSLVAGAGASGAVVLLTVRDTGQGMDEAARSRAFEPYFSTKERGRGTGLGLASVHGTVVDSGGDIRIESAPGAGTTVRIWLPRVAQAHAGPAPTA
jgi:two-component system cell cycle sensor histidine kinase/response regulator CckA